MQVNRLDTAFKSKNVKKAPSFKANIEILNKEGFLAVKRGLTDFYEVRGDYFLKDAAIGKEKAFSEQIRSCTYASIINPKTGKLNSYHLSPYEENMGTLRNIRETMLRQAEELKHPTQSRLEGFINGANSSSFRYGDSFEFFEHIKNTFEEISNKVGMDYSILAGRHDLASEIEVISDASKNTHYLHFDSPFIGDKDLKCVSRYFEINKISPKDTLKLNGVDITKEFSELTNRPGLYQEIMAVIKKLIEIS